MGRMGHCSVDVVYPRLNDWTCLQWALNAAVMRGGDAALPELLFGGLVVFLAQCGRLT